MKPPRVQIGCKDNVYVRSMHFADAGDTELGHAHHFDHFTLLSHGSLQVTVEGRQSVFKAPTLIYIRKDKMHELVALEPNTVAACIHALRNADNTDILDPSMVPAGVSALLLAGPLVKG